jgi:DNA-binding CsgD family transcriptional regulator
MLAADAVSRLTEREREVLRLLLRGHDIKSIARELSISTTAANERLRAARQKLGVSSSREAARILAAEENHDSSVDRQFGVPRYARSPQHPRTVFIWIGVIMAVAISTTIGLMAVLGSHASAAGAPMVVRTNPSANAVIAPGPFTMSVTFDQPMADGSFSFVQKAKETFPNCAFPAQLSADKRTFTVRCTAEPGRSYEIWFNSPPYMNFKGVNGIPAQPHQLLFRAKAR